MNDKKYPSDIYLESVATKIDFAKQVSVEAVVVMAKELLALRKAHDGWRLVPVEPTREMLMASYREASVYSPSSYRAMLTAAPEPE